MVWNYSFLSLSILLGYFNYMGYRGK